MKSDAEYRELLRERGVNGEYIDAFGGIDLDRIGNIVGVYRTSMHEQDSAAFDIKQEVSILASADEIRIRRVDGAIAKQLQSSIERNSRMVTRLQTLAAQLDKQANGALRDVGSDLLAISKDEEPEPWL